MKILSFFPEISLMPHVQVVRMLIKYLIGANLGATLRLNFEKRYFLEFWIWACAVDKEAGQRIQSICWPHHSCLTLMMTRTTQRRKEMTKWPEFCRYWNWTLRCGVMNVRIEVIDDRISNWSGPSAARSISCGCDKYKHQSRIASYHRGHVCDVFG